MAISTRIVAKAMEAYQLFCPFVPGEQDLPDQAAILQRAREDARSIETWMEKYKQEHSEQWWKLKPVAEIQTMLWFLPLNTESFLEVSQLVKCLCM